MGLNDPQKDEGKTGFGGIMLGSKFAPKMVAAGGTVKSGKAVEILQSLGTASGLRSATLIAGGGVAQNKLNRKESNDTQKEVAKSTAVTGTGATLGLLGAKAIVSGLGFKTGGILLGSKAATMMAAAGGAVKSGSAVAILQSIGAAGLGSATLPISFADGEVTQNKLNITGLNDSLKEATKTTAVKGTGEGIQLGSKATTTMMADTDETAGLGSGTPPISIADREVEQNKLNKTGSNDTLKEVVKSTAVTATGATLGLLGAKTIVSGLGFKTGGILLGSKAATMMAAAGGAVKSGSVVAILQSIGVIGFGSATFPILLTGGGITYWIYYKYFWNKKPEKENDNKVD